VPPGRAAPDKHLTGIFDEKPMSGRANAGALRGARP
jgi:hypothetical protein